MEFTTKSPNDQIINVNVKNDENDILTKQNLIMQYRNRDVKLKLNSDYIKNMILKKLKFDEENKKIAIKVWFMDKIKKLDGQYFEKHIVDNDIRINLSDIEYTYDEYNNFITCLDKQIERYQDILKNIDEMYNYLTLDELYYLGM
jgi:hypothetical protein